MDIDWATHCLGIANKKTLHHTKAHQSRVFLIAIYTKRFSNLPKEHFNDLNVLALKYLVPLDPWPRHQLCYSRKFSRYTLVRRSLRPIQNELFQVDSSHCLFAAEGQRPRNYWSCGSCWIFHLIFALSTPTTVLPPIFLKYLKLSPYLSL